MREAEKNGRSALNQVDVDMETVIDADAMVYASFDFDSKYASGIVQSAIASQARLSYAEQAALLDSQIRKLKW